jgi:hypothetical protein
MPFGNDSNGSIPFDQLTANDGGMSRHSDYRDDDSEDDGNYIRNMWVEASREVAEKNIRVSQAKAKALTPTPTHDPTTSTTNLIFSNAKPDNFVPFSGIGRTLGKIPVQPDTCTLVKVNKYKIKFDEKLEMNKILIEQLKEIETVNQIKHIDYEIFEPIEYTDLDDGIYIEILQAQIDLIETENSRLISIVQIFN